jgi:type II secretory pathway pseudopilin PulG
MVKSRLRAYTLIEIIIVIAVFTALGFLALPVAIREIQVGKVDSYVKDVRSAIELAALDSFSGKDELSHGVKINPDSIVIYAGPNYSEAIDELILEVPMNVSITNISLNDSSDEFIFPLGDIRPSAHGTFQVSDDYSTFEFEINREGLLVISKI